MKSHLTEPHQSYNNLDLGHAPAIYEVTDPILEKRCIGEGGMISIKNYWIIAKHNWVPDI